MDIQVKAQSQMRFNHQKKKIDQSMAIFSSEGGTAEGV